MTEDWELAADALRDDGYSEDEIRDLLGDAPPTPRRLGRKGWLTENPRREAAAAAEQPLARAARVRDEEDRRVIERPLRPAPVLDRVQFSREEKVERIAKAMCELRSLEWSLLSFTGQRGFLALAELAVRAIEVVEEHEQVLFREPKRRRYGGARTARA